MLKTKIESLLFISNKPLTVKAVVNFLKKEGDEVKSDEVEAAFEELKEKYNNPENGFQIIQSGDNFQMVSNPDSADLVKKFVKDDMTGELTPASLETLTVVAYRGPISKAELEQIRGVNCSLILRNLLIRGLVEASENNVSGDTIFRVTVEFLKYLGLNSVEELPDYEKLHSAVNLEEYLKRADANVANNHNANDANGDENSDEGIVNRGEQIGNKKIK
jgi:segregation and condensation protein B